MGALFAYWGAVTMVVAPTRVKESKEEEVLYIASIRNKVITGSTGVSRTFFQLLMRVYLENIEANEKHNAYG